MVWIGFVDSGLSIMVPGFVDSGFCRFWFRFGPGFVSCTTRGTDRGITDWGIAGWEVADIGAIEYIESGLNRTDFGSCFDLVLLILVLSILVFAVSGSGSDLALPVE